jgi:hypothetical protein
MIIVNFLQVHPLGMVYDAPFDVYLGEHDVFQPAGSPIPAARPS